MSAQELVVTSDDVVVVRPLPVGAVLEFCGEVGVVVRDGGTSRLDVMVDGAVHPWFWYFEGKSCRVVTDPAAELPGDVVRALCERFDLAPVRLGAFDSVPESERETWRVAPLAGERRFDVDAADQVVGRTELEVMRAAVQRLGLAARVLEAA